LHSQVFEYGEGIDPGIVERPETLDKRDDRACGVFFKRARRLD